jgi:hypothetical protein
MRHIWEVQNKVQKSNSTSVQYVTLQNINWMKKCETMPVWLSKMVLAQHFAEFAEAGKRHSKA